MSSTRREEAVERIIAERVSAIIRTNDQALAADAMSAAVAGGFRVIEFRLRRQEKIGALRHTTRPIGFDDGSAGGFDDDRGTVDPVAWR